MICHNYESFEVGDIAHLVEVRNHDERMRLVRRELRRYPHRGPENAALNSIIVGREVEKQFLTCRRD